MLTNYVKTSWRYLSKNKAYSFLNIGGLALGMSVAILIGLWVVDELTFDTSHENYKSIAQLRRYYTDPNTQETNGVENMHYPTAALVRRDYSRYFKKAVMAWWLNDYSLSTGEKTFAQRGTFIEDGGLEMFSLKMVSGSYGSLNDPHSVVLSRSAALAFFGNENAINKTVKIDNRMDVVVRGVYEDIAPNSRFGGVKFFAPWDLWVSANDWIKQASGGWDNSSFPVFVQLQPGVTMEAASQAISGFYDQSVPPEVSAGMRKYKTHALLYPMKDWHLYSEFKNGLPSGGRISFVWLFGIVGIFVVLLACINFINLTTARSEKRAKEVGIRKTMGSGKRQLIFQFLSESFLVVFFAVVLSLCIVLVSLPGFNQLADKKIAFPFSNLFFWLGILVFAFFTAITAGAYPAFYLSSFQPVKVLKGKIRVGRFASLPRKALVVFQFTVSVVLIIGTVVVHRQIEYAQDRPVGYNRESLLTIKKSDPNYKGKLEVLQTRLMNTGKVKGVEFASSPLTQVYNNSSDFDWTGKPAREFSFAATNVSYGFGKLIGWQVIAGRDFSKEFGTDSAKIIINETAAKDMGLRNPVGEVVRTAGGTKSFQIVGIVKDIVMGSPYEPQKRAIFFLDPSHQAANHIIIKIDPQSGARESLAAVEGVFKDIVPTALFDYKFADEDYAKKFSQEQRIGKLSSLFAVLAICISCLGLFGLSSFVAEQRKKEIGIRKVVGASVLSIWVLLSRQYIGLVLAALLIASPVSYYIMNGWVQKYTYHPQLSLWIFAMAGAGAILITLITVSFQSIKAALTNPVRSLKSE
jgi:putative ABC transport system permease protein